MRITIFGAAGNVGSRVVAEALARGHDVTAVVRDQARADALPGAAAVRVGDARNADDVSALSAGADVVVAATRPVPGRERELVETTQTLLAGLTDSGTRLLISGGAGSLTVPGTDGLTVVDDPDYLSPAYRDLARACVDQLETCRGETRVDWTYLSPPALLEPGERTGHYRLGTDELLVDEQGASRISMEDLAVALVDEIERPRHRGRRFTVAS